MCELKIIDMWILDGFVVNFLPHGSSLFIYA